MNSNNKIIKIIKSYKKLLILGCLLLIIYIIAVTKFYILYSNLAVDNQKNQLMLIAKGVKTNLEYEIMQSKKILEIVSNSLDITGDMDNEDINKLNRYLKYYIDEDIMHIDNFIITDDSLNSGNRYYYKKFNYTSMGKISSEKNTELELWRDSNQQFLLSMKMTCSNKYDIYQIINLKEIYNNTIKDLTIGEKGYVLVKDATGMIIMHELNEQLGINALTGREEIYPDMNLDTDSLVKMLSNQLEGKTDIEIYKSYWWSDEQPILVKKIVAYTPLKLGDGMLIVAAVVDFEEVISPVRNSFISILFISVLFFICLLCLTYKSFKTHHALRISKRENRTLKKLNKTLQELEENKKIVEHQQRLKIIGTMTSGITHEFNNLLTPIMGYSGMILSHMEPDNQFYEDINEIYTASEKAKDIVKGIKLLSKKNKDVEFNYCDINQLLLSVKKMITSIKPEKVMVEFDVESITGKIWGNSTQLNQVLLNIFANALNVVDNQEGKIILNYTEYHKQKICKISIKDNGIGMDSKLQKKIFDPFFTTDYANGTGLGLAIANKIIIAHKGNISVESKVGHGSTFIITLPIEL